MTINVDKKVVHDRNRVYYWRYRGLTGCERPDYDVAISLSCPRRLRPAEMGNPSLDGQCAQDRLAQKRHADLACKRRLAVWGLESGAPEVLLERQPQGPET